MGLQAALPQRLLEMSDVARMLGLSYSGARLLAEVGKLEPVAVTVRGLRLFKEEDVQRCRELREEERARRSNGS